MKKRLGLVLVLAMVMSFVVAVPASAAEGEFVIHAKTDWATPMLWAWGGDTAGLFTAWPGEAFAADPDNAGWYTFTAPAVENIIVSDNGAVQTVDLAIESKELWVTVTEAGADGKFAADIAYEAPEGFVVAGAAEEVATDDAAAETEVPKTGVADLMYVYMGLAGLSGAGFVAAKKRKNA